MREKKQKREREEGFVELLNEIGVNDSPCL